MVCESIETPRYHRYPDRGLDVFLVTREVVGPHLMRVWRDALPVLCRSYSPRSPGTDSACGRRQPGARRQRARHQSAVVVFEPERVAELMLEHAEEIDPAARHRVAAAGVPAPAGCVDVDRDDAVPVLRQLEPVERADL